MRWVYIQVAVLLTAGVALAQGRRGAADGSVAQLFVSLPKAVRIGGVILLPQQYRVSAEEDSLAFADAATMVVVAIAKASVTPLEPSVDVATANVVVHEDSIDIVIARGDWSYKVTGEVTTASAGSAPGIDSNKVEPTVRTPRALTDLETVQAAVAHYIAALRDCVDKAQKSHWETDDPRFKQCLCPFLEKWRLPKIDKALRVHRVLSTGLNGFSFTATPDGHASACRVWTGVRPPPNETTWVAPKADGADAKTP